MFKCDGCGVTTQAGEKCVRLPVQLRRTEYPIRKGMDYSGYRPCEIITDRGGTGLEAVKEANFCTQCAENPPKPFIV